MLEPEKAAQQIAEHEHRAIAILDVRRRHHHTEHKAVRVHDDVTLAAFYLLAAVAAVCPPFCVFSPTGYQ